MKRITDYLRGLWQGTGRHRGETPGNLPPAAEERPEPPQASMRPDETLVDLPPWKPRISPRIDKPRPGRGIREAAVRRWYSVLESHAGGAW